MAERTRDNRTRELEQHVLALHNGVKRKQRRFSGMLCVLVGIGWLYAAPPAHGTTLGLPDNSLFEIFLDTDDADTTPNFVGALTTGVGKVTHIQLQMGRNFFDLSYDSDNDHVVENNSDAFSIMDDTLPGAVALDPFGALAQVFLFENGLWQGIWSVQVGPNRIEVRSCSGCTWSVNPASVGAPRAAKNKKGSARVPETGQVLCFDSAGMQIDCAGTGQDGALQAGVEIPTPRFIDIGDGTIKDNLTGLIWLKDANCPGGALDWQGALDFVAGINDGKNDCGDRSGKRGTHRTDWRLPNIRELHSLIDFGFVSPAISNAAGTGQGSGSDPFTNFQTTRLYWSSTTYQGDPPILAWVVNVVDGFIIAIGKSGVDGFVLAVRGGS